MWQHPAPFLHYTPNHAPPTNLSLHNTWKAKRKLSSHLKPGRFSKSSKNKFWRSNSSESATLAPRNTTSFLMLANKSGGVAPLVSPYPVTPAVLPTPKFSPLWEGVVDMAKAEWGLDGYGTMKGLIRVRSVSGDEHEVRDDSDVELGRFEMVCGPGLTEEEVGGKGMNILTCVLASRVDDQDAHIGWLEEQNLVLKERIFLMERQMGVMRRRLLMLEAGYHAREVDRSVSSMEEVVDNLCSEKSVED